MSEIPEIVRLACEEKLGVSISASTALTGGDINEARLLVTDQGRFFLKMNDDPALAPVVFRKEAGGLEMLKKAGPLRVPEVIAEGTVGEYGFLILEYIEPGAPSPVFWRDFGAGLADLHRSTAPAFGLPEDNFIGSLEQKNTLTPDWPAFFIGSRLEPMVNMAYKSGRFELKDVLAFQQLYRKMAGLFPKEQPALIHGDLWNGNYLVDRQGAPVLIDPAVSYAHREMDLAMTRLFGGFPPEFYEAYHESYPLEAGWRERLPVGQLYYLLAHVNMFGGSYVQQCRAILKGF
ncbi:MAG: fructosamine kinase family protein [Lewinellaceae bacterium]|nr:fructosamine kinase family protein [Lewinella sp.]MCB9281835.1 fructosamine kinase family protein [Lewinellaceae bacterium]